MPQALGKLGWWQSGREVALVACGSTGEGQTGQGAGGLMMRFLVQDRRPLGQCPQLLGCMGSLATG